VAPFAKSNFADSTTTGQTSEIRFIEDNWGLGRMGGHSFDALAGPVANIVDFSEPRTDILILDPDTGQPVEF
jgi:phospholipase C